MIYTDEEAISIEWLKNKYPIHGVYGTEDYFRKAQFIHRLIAQWVEYVNQQEECNGVCQDTDRS